MSAFVPEVQPQLRVLCRSLARIVREYYKDPQHRAEFEKWHLEKYGEPYSGRHCRFEYRYRYAHSG